MSPGISCESLSYLFGGRIAGIIKNKAHFSIRCLSRVSLCESLYNHVLNENKKTYMYNGGGSTHIDSHKKNSESIYPVRLPNPVRVALYFPDPLTHTPEAGQQNPTNPTTSNHTQSSNHESGAPAATNGGRI